MTTPDNYRVYKITDTDRKNFVTTRTEKSTTNEQLLQEAIQTKLSPLVEKLAELGFAPETEDKRPIRLPISDDSLAALRIASESTGLPQAALLALVLRGHCGQGVEKQVPQEAPKTRRKARTTKAAPAPKAAPKTKRRATKAAPAGKAAPRRAAKKGAK